MPIISALEVIVIALIAISAIITVFNSLTIRRPRASGNAVEASVAVLIPMRNEASNALAACASAIAQQDLNHFDVRVLDDQSTDGTREILARISAPNFVWRTGGELPMGWLGKNFALHTLAAEANAEYLVFLDADVRLDSRAVAASIELMERFDLAYLSPYPRQITGSLLEKLVQPLLQWSWFASLPLLPAERSLRASTVVANGQFFIVRSAAYRKCGGHAAIRGEVLDDLELARALRRSGFRGNVVDGSKIASCRMYESAGQLIAGYSKSQWRAFGGIGGALGVISLLIATSIAPLVLAIANWKFGWFCYIAMVFTRLIVAIRTRSSIISSFLHPLAIAFWIYLIIRSLILKSRGKLEWRGRAI